MTKKEEIKKKPSLSWTLDDYKTLGEEPPECVLLGRKEGEIMEPEEVEEWAKEEVHCLSVFQEDYPDKFNSQYAMFFSDLEYLHSLGKISKEEYDKLTDKGILNFGQETK